MNFKKFNKYLIIVYAFLIALVAYLIFLFNQMLTTQINDNSIMQVNEIHATLELSLEKTIADSVSNLSLFSKHASDANINYDNVINFFERQSQSKDFDKIFYVDTSGNGLCTDGTTKDFSENEIFNNVSVAGYAVTSLYQVEGTNNIAFDVAMPIVNNGVTTGFFISTTNAENFYNNIYGPIDFDGYAFILDDNYNVIFTTDSKQLSVQNATNNDLSFLSDEMRQKILTDVNNQASGNINYTINGTARILSYAAIDMTQWTLFVSVDEAFTSTSITKSINSVMFVSVTIFLLLIVLSFYTGFSRMKLLKSVEYNAHIDALTGLPNLQKLKIDMKNILIKNVDTSYSLIKFDITNFKAINEMYGFEIGNRVLKAFNELSKGVNDTSLKLSKKDLENSSTIIARTGVDEFMIFSTTEILAKTELNIGTFQNYCKTYIPELKNHKISFKYGRYYIDFRETDVDEIVSKVNLAHKIAKETKGVTIHDYDDRFKQQIRFESEITNKMRSALDNNEFKMFLQPKFDVADNEIVGAEALVRWIEDDGKMIFPDQFIPIFEKTGFIINLDNFILEAACKTIRAWIDNGVGHLPISVNYSRLSFNNPNFIQNLCEIVDKHNVPHEYIEVELTESTIMDNENLLEQLFIDIHKLGFKISIDDFGSGYSSLGLLKNLKINTLKLDRSFFTNSKDVIRSDLVIDGIVRLAQSLNIYVVAEGIETIEQLEFLKTVQCDATQGYYFSRPIPVSDFEKKYSNIFNKNSLKKQKVNLQETSTFASEEQKFNFVLNILNNIKIPANMFNYSFTKMKCNKDALEMFEITNNEWWKSNFFDLSPEFQPDGINSAIGARKYVDIASKIGYIKFNWIHYNSKFQELPCEIILSKLHVLDDNGEELFIAIINDKRGDLATFNNENELLSDGFFFDKITDKALLNIITGLSAEWFFNYDVTNSSVQILGTNGKNLNIKNEKYTFPNEKFIQDVIYHEDIDIFNKLVYCMHNNIAETFEMRLIQLDGSNAYYKFVYKSINNADNTPLFVVGKAYNINKQKTLESLASKDLLTNCYNKISTENLIKKAISENPNSQHALFIVDIDDFKSINDNLGHAFGDNVLKDISSNLHSYFREFDIIGRIGGDEFVIFLKNIKDTKIITKKAATIVEAFKNNYTGETKNYKVSGSVGISLYPQNAMDFETLYTSADKALYQSKISGKDCYTFYSEDFSSGTMSNLTILENVGRIADAYFDSDFISNVFELLYEMQGTDTSLDMVLKFIGKHLNIDRCFIFESLNDGENYSKTHEWCHHDFKMQKQNFQNIPRISIAEFFDSLDSSGVYFCNDFNTLKTASAKRMIEIADIKSLLLLQTKDKQQDYIPLLIGFGDCRESRVWTEKEINSARYVLKMISLFILASHQRKQLNEANNIEPTTNQ